MDSDGSPPRLALSVPVTLGAGEGTGLTARDDEDLECPRNQSLTFFSDLPSLDMALQTIYLAREGSNPLSITPLTHGIDAQAHP